MKYTLIFHANLHYSNLAPDQYDFVIRHSYERTLDLFNNKYPNARWVFEASGYTLEKIKEVAPDVFEKFQDAFQRNCEFMGSPYAHSMLPNFPYEDGLHSLEFSMESYQKLLGFTPVSGWNPECAWTDRIPEMYKSSGFKNLMLDWDSFLLATNENVRKVEYNSDKSRQDGKNLPYYNIDPDTETLHFPIKLKNGLIGLMRSDRVCNEMLWYLMGQSEEAKDEKEFPTLEKVVDAIRYWSGKKKQGYLCPFAEDAEYAGTTGYFFMKYYKKLILFKDSPSSIERLGQLIGKLLEMGDLITVQDAVETLPALEDVNVKYEDKSTWHRTYSHAWANTPWAKEMDPICMDLHNKILEAEKMVDTEEKKKAIKQAWFHLINAENSDGRWPPPPLSPADYNIQYCKDHIKKTIEALKNIQKI